MRPICIVRLATATLTNSSAMTADGCWIYLRPFQRRTTAKAYLGNISASRRTPAGRASKDHVTVWAG